MNSTRYSHPNFRFFRLTQWIVFVMMLVVILAVPLQIVIALIYPQAILFYLSAGITLFFVAPLLLYLTATPTVSLDEHGITLYPFLGKSRRIDWEQIDDVKGYPLLPKQNHEVNKRLMVGRKRYQQAEGIMLVTSHLPLVYLVGGFFVGERGHKIVALTNRTHTDYEYLAKQVMKYTRKSKLDS